VQAGMSIVVGRVMIRSHSNTRYSIFSSVGRSSNPGGGKGTGVGISAAPGTNLAQYTGAPSVPAKMES
jgi:hypothetical protein